MILQRDAKINIWGWASKDEKVRVKFNGKSYKTTASDGKWIVQLPADESRWSLYNGHLRQTINYSLRIF